MYNIPQKDIDTYLASKGKLKKTKSSNAALPDKSVDCESTFEAVVTNKKFAAMKTGNFEDLNDTGILYYIFDLFQIGLFGLFCARHGTALTLLSMKTSENMSTTASFLRVGYLDYSLEQLFKARGYNPKEVYLFYDIACHYKKHVEKVNSNDLMQRILIFSAT